MMKISIIGLLFTLLATTFSSAQSDDQPAPQFDESLYSSMKYRNIGPFRGGASNHSSRYTR